MNVINQMLLLLTVYVNIMWNYVLFIKNTTEKLSLVSTESGLSKLKECCAIRQNWSLLSKIEETLVGNHKVHRSCRRRFTDAPYDKVNCDCAEELGLQIKKQWNNSKFASVKLHKADRITTMANILNVRDIGNDVMSIDPNILLQAVIRAAFSDRTITAIIRCCLLSIYRLLSGRA